MKKLIFRNSLSPGDIVMLTAAVRDLHLCHPDRYLTDVRTSCAEIWDHNPWLAPLDENDPDASIIDVEYPLIHQSNKLPYHYIHGFMQDISSRLGVEVKPTCFHGDIHLSDQEKSWYSQVYELVGQDIPFWIIDAGGKFDVTIKWWQAERYQQVVDYFRGRIAFVQIGAPGHFHPRLDGVIDLRGRTDLRQLIRLVHHSQGALCTVTALMHFAAAIESGPGSGHEGRTGRPCVVIAGAREAAHWEAYPGHQFIATNGSVPCALSGGCWRDRTFPLGDGDKRDNPENLCLRPAGTLPQCMDIITAADVIRRIEYYFAGGACRYLSDSQHKAFLNGVEKTADNQFANPEVRFPV